MPNKEKAMKQITLAIFVMVLGSFAIADAAGAEGREWNVVTVELAPGAVDARHFHPGVELDTRMEMRSEEHTSELQSRPHLVCRLLLEKKKTPTRLDHGSMRSRETPQPVSHN